MHLIGDSHAMLRWVNGWNLDRFVRRCVLFVLVFDLDQKGRDKTRMDSNDALLTCMESCWYRTPNRSLDRMRSGRNGKRMSKTGSISFGSMLSGFLKPSRARSTCQTRPRHRIESRSYL